MNVSRRGFVGSAAAFPILFTGCGTTKSGYSKNGLINIGVCGLGRISITMDIPYTIKYTDRCRFTAVCDLDAKRLVHGKEFVENWYRKNAKMEVPVKAYSHLEEMLKDPEIDAVMICLPDHWHALAAAQVLAAKKHLWLQKPFAQTIREGRVIANLAKQNNLVVQVASWQRSVTQFQQVVELVLNGRIGDIKRVEVGIGLDRAGGSSKPEEVPVTLDYDRWLGPTPGANVTPYNWTRCHTQNLKRIGDRPGWIQLAPYGWGMITNWGAHHIDIAQWGLGCDGKGPDKVEGTCEWMDMSDDKLWNVHTKYDLHYTYGKADLHVCDKYPMGIKFIGEKGDWLYCMRGAVKVTPSDPDVPSNGDMQPLMASRNALLEPIANPANPVKKSLDHWLNWLDAIAAGDPTVTTTNAEDGHRSTAACSLGHMVMELGRGKKDGASINYDWKTESTGNAEADKLMEPMARGDYNLNAVLKPYGLDVETILRG